MSKWKVVDARLGLTPITVEADHASTDNGSLTFHNSVSTAPDAGYGAVLVKAWARGEWLRCELVIPGSAE